MSVLLAVLAAGDVDPVVEAIAGLENRLYPPHDIRCEGFTGVVGELHC